MEARAASLLNHPRICQVRDFGLTPTHVPYLVMDWINGIPLSKKVKVDGPQPTTEAVKIFQQICAGLENAHAHKVVHRDLKPDNIMLTRDTDGSTLVYIVDFGIAKLLPEGRDKSDPVDHNPDDDGSEFQENLEQLTTTGTFVGTPLFMSPEQAKSPMSIDERSDIYSLGCLMYFVLCGEAPLIGNSAIETIAKHLHATPADFSGRLKIPPDLRAIVFKCMEKKPSDRYQTVTELATDLKKMSKGVNITRRPLVYERENRVKGIKKIASFIIGFGAMYLISIFVQNTFDTTNKDQSNKGQANKDQTNKEQINKDQTRTLSKNESKNASRVASRKELARHEDVSPKNRKTRD
jgi:serine/threonine-protein kinase